MSSSLLSDECRNSFYCLPNLFLARNGGDTVAILRAIAAKLSVAAAVQNHFGGICWEICAILFIGLPVHHAVFRAIDREHPQGRAREILGGIGGQQDEAGKILRVCCGVV